MGLITVCIVSLNVRPFFIAFDTVWIHFADLNSADSDCE